MARKSRPYRCPICAIRPGDYAGKLRLESGPVPTCDNHEKELKKGLISEVVNGQTVPATTVSMVVVR